MDNEMKRCVDHLMSSESVVVSPFSDRPFFDQDNEMSGMDELKTIH
jgi:hypothetical protein